MNLSWLRNRSALWTKTVLSAALVLTLTAPAVQAAAVPRLLRMLRPPLQQASR